MRPDECTGRKPASDTDAWKQLRSPAWRTVKRAGRNLPVTGARSVQRPPAARSSIRSWRGLYRLLRQRRSTFARRHPPKTPAGRSCDARREQRPDDRCHRDGGEACRVGRAGSLPGVPSASRPMRGLRRSPRQAPELSSRRLCAACSCNGPKAGRDAGRCSRTDTRAYAAGEHRRGLPAAQSPQGASTRMGKRSTLDRLPPRGTLSAPSRLDDHCPTLEAEGFTEAM